MTGVAADILSVRETIAQRVTRIVRDYILNFQPGFRPGERVYIDQLSRMFGVSPTPIKEALKRLEAEGLIEVRARRGCFVACPSLRDIEETIAIRAGLEQLALRLCGGQPSDTRFAALARALEACEAHVTAGQHEDYRREDIAFHRTLVEMSENNQLVSLYLSLLQQLQITTVYIPRGDHNVRASLAEHRQLLRVIRGGRLEEIERMLEEHWHRSKERVKAAYAAYLRESTRPDGDGASVGGSSGPL